MNPRDLDFLIDYVRRNIGIQLDASKSYLLKSRLNDVVRSEGFESMEALCRELRGTGATRLLPKIVDAMTTNETSFFRDGLPFKHLVDEVFPLLIKARAPKRRLRIWSAASSSGQEAVTLGILLSEHFPEIRGWDVKILASDISPAMVERCRQACFTEGEIGRGMPAEFKSRYFDRVSEGWQAKQAIRDLIQVRQLNLIHPLPSIESQDLVLLRNVLIYFDEPTRQSIFRGISRILATDGFVLLGTAEKPRSESYERAFGPQANVFRRAS
ncbi:MAG: CheR family methyltransferase [Planctomycetota bacterium]